MSDEVPQIVVGDSEKIKVELGEEVISDAGQGEVSRFISTHHLRNVVDSWHWVTKDGKFPKRFANALYRDYSIKIDPQLLEQLGNLAAKYVVRSTYHVDFTRKLDWAAGAFGDSGSCFWGGRRSARTIMQDNSVMAVRLYRCTSYGTYNGYARAWMVDVSRKLKCHEAYVLFNAYGAQLEEIGGVVAKMLKLSSGPAFINNNGGTHGTVFLNRSGLGIFVSTPDVVGAAGRLYVGSTRLELGLRRKYCACKMCGRRVSRSTMHPLSDGRMACSNCY